MTVRMNSSAIAERLRKAATKALVQSTELVRTEAVRLILDTPKTGHTYRRRGTEHQASAPGEPPASDTGRLVNGIRTEYDFNTMTGKVVSGEAYGAHLEYGTQTIEPRPFLRPALVNKRQEIEQIVRSAIREAMK